MDKNSLFIFLTHNGSVFNRTNGKNERIIFGKEYFATNGMLIFTKELDKIVKVTRTSSTGKLAYTKNLTEPGMYNITSLFILPLPRTSKDIRILYNRIKKLSSKPKFKLIEDVDLADALKIEFYVKNDQGVLETRFSLNINPDLLRSEDIEVATDTIEKIMLNLHVLLKNIKIENQREIIWIVNDEFIKTRLVNE